MYLCQRNSWLPRYIYVDIKKSTSLTQRKLKMKTLAIALIASFSIGSAFAQAAKQPESIAKMAPAATAPAAPAKAEAPKEEMKLAKKKDAPKADAKSEAKPASPAKADDKKAEASKK